MKLKNGKVITRDILLELESNGMREVDIAKYFGISRQYLRRIRIRNGWSKRVSRVDCGRGGRIPLDKQREKYNKYMRERYHANKNPKYKTIRVGNIFMSEHRYLMEKHLNRRLKRGEVVHHKDGNPINNDIDNLELMTVKEHYFYHRYNQTEGENAFA